MYMKILYFEPFCIPWSSLARIYLVTANSVDPDQLASEEANDLALHCN